MNYRSLVLPFLAALLLTACPPDLAIVPAFVLVEDLELTSAGTGTATEDISEVWAFADNEFLGAFPLPARIPVPRAGTTELRLEAGVRQNGISSTPEIYEFYAPITRTLELAGGQQVDLGVLPVSYRTDVRCGIFEDFEAGSPRLFTTLLVGDTMLQASTEVVRSGEFSGKLTLTEADPRVDLVALPLLRDLIARRPYVWLEVDFLSEAPVAWGITGRSGGETFTMTDPGFRPRDNWTKIYFNLSELIVRSDLEELQLYFSARKLDGAAPADVFLDNIKLLYF